jgi:hypothetical protein
MQAAAAAPAPSVRGSCQHLRVSVAIAIIAPQGFDSLGPLRESSVHCHAPIGSSML